MAGKTHPFIAILSPVAFPLTLILSRGESGQRGSAQDFFAAGSPGPPASTHREPTYKAGDFPGAMAYNNRGTAKRGLMDYDGAIADYRKSLELNPHNTTARGKLGETRRLVRESKSQP